MIRSSFFTSSLTAALLAVVPQLASAQVPPAAPAPAEPAEPPAPAPPPVAPAKPAGPAAAATPPASSVPVPAPPSDAAPRGAADGASAEGAAEPALVEPPVVEPSPAPPPAVEPASALRAPLPSLGAATGVTRSWFYRDPIAFELGDRLTVTWYGDVQVAFIYDTTRSYGDTIGSSLVARGDTYEGTVGRFQASARSSRFGLAIDAAPVFGITPSSVLEADFAGDQPTSNVGSSERAYYDSPTFRLRHAYMNLDNDVIDVLIGQTDDVFGWQNTPSSVSRHTQLRLARTFGQGSPVGLDVAAAALRPAQRDAQMPDIQAGVRFTLNEWQGLYTRDGIPQSRPLSLGVSGVVRQFDADAFTPPPTQTSNKVVGWGASIDAMLPIISAKDEYDRGNRLTIGASYVVGTGIGDLMRVDGGAKFPPLPNPARAAPPPEYEANVDEGLVSFDRLGVLNTIDWDGFRVDAQYYLPPSGRVRLAAVYTEAYSKNMAELYPQGGAEIELLTHVADRVRYLEGNVFWDVTPEIRLGAACIYTQVRYLDDERPHSIRAKATAHYFF